MEVPVTFYGCVAFVLPALLRQSATTICGAEVADGRICRCDLTGHPGACVHVLIHML